MKIDEFGFSFNGTLSSTEITRFINVGFDIQPSTAAAPVFGDLFIERTLQLIDKTRGITLIDKERNLVLI